MPPLSSERAARRVLWREAVVRDVVVETPRARTLALDVPDWPGHRAGQHLDVRLTAEDGYQAERSYSIASAPELDRVELTIELVDDGEVSPYFVEVVEPGDVFEVRGPVGGHFTWSADSGPEPLLLIAGGSGLVPLMAMVRHRAARASTVPTTLLVSARSPEDLLYADELVDAPALSIARTYTRTQPPGWTGFARRVNHDMLRAVAPAPDSGARVFVCGPTPFVELVTGLLVDLGFPPRTIHAERFGPTGGTS
ncbi:MAG TPA: ferredoxin reductase [Solirubrobacteraceae bacterium]|nr:ferredoxin reductase [Solirubrobacteraceae bacterium]